MKPSENPVWKPGDLVQVRKGVTGAGDIGIVLCEGAAVCVWVLFGDRQVLVHCTNLQKPRNGSRAPRP